MRAFSASLLVGASLLVAGPAAAVGEIEVDAPSPLFGSVASMVPLESRTATFEVRNTGTESGYLRVSVGNVSATSTKYADAMTLASSVPGFVGAPVALSSAEPCSVLTEGLVLEPGDSVTVTTALALADMPGKMGQRSTASFRIRVGLSDARPGTIAPTQCSPNAAIVDGVPVTPAVTGAEETPEPDASATPAPDRPIGAEPWPTFFGLNLSPNTVQLLQDWGGLVPAIAFILGSGGFFIAARRRRKRQADEDDSDFDDPDLDGNYRV